MTLDELESSWATLQLPHAPDGISGRRAVGLPADRPVYLAVDSRARRHLLVQMPDGVPPVRQRETRSLEVETTRFQIGTNPEALYVDLMCTDSAQYHTSQHRTRSHRTSRQHQDAKGSISVRCPLAAFWAVKTAQ
jgi:hypothetical protein